MADDWGMAELRTILFTDIVGSVNLKRQMPGTSDTERDQAFIERVLRPHRERIERELAALGGRVVSTAGDGHFLVFSDTISAARWATGIQKSHRDEPIATPGGQSVRVRISMHLGVPQIDPHDENNFIGKPVDYAARLSDYATGGQILVSRSVVAILEDAGMDEISFHSHGQRELRGIGRVEIFELVYDRAGPHKMRPQPREEDPRQWTVLPATMGLSAFRSGGGDELPAAPPSPGRQAVAKGRQSTDVVPLRLGNYELEERLGSGGMGDVYRARHTQFSRVRAVKIIKQHFVDTGNEEVIRRFYQEIKAVGALEHPNIVVAIDSSAPTDRVHYLVMEYIDGVATDELVKRGGPLTVADACEIARQAARGLDYIHQHGMVHRDIKPSNLMVTVVRGEHSGSDAKPQAADQAVVKILDLGLALLVGEDQQRLTLFDNRAIGTAMYMSPEQWKTTSVDIRADIYSLGCSLYHLLAGKPPFWKSDLKPEKAHEKEKLPPIKSNQPIPRPLWEVLERMTAKNPNERYSDPAEVAAALAPFAEGNQLAQVVRGYIESGDGNQTEKMGHSDTMLAKSAESDTLAGKPASWGVPTSFPPAARSKAWRTAMAILILLGVGVIGWLAVQATARRESVQQANEARRNALHVAAGFAASEILKEINLRFDTLSRIAVDEELQQLMSRVSNQPTDEAALARLQDWLGSRRADSQSAASSDSWFINDERGVQVARSPRSDSVGENFAHRDYFHGQGKEWPEGTQDLKPLEAPHLSAVYRSTSTGHLKVAFSVPIENGKKGKQRQVIGVLAMSVDLGEFKVLENDLPQGHEVVLVDLRESTIDGTTRRGLVLHHESEKPYREGQQAPWISSELLSRIDEILAGEKGQRPVTGGILPDYRDAVITEDKPYWGALKLVRNVRPDEPMQDFKWLVIVQEPMSR
jgi:serine/threonine protein kinase/class 3 adenylate cyclase